MATIDIDEYREEVLEDWRERSASKDHEIQLDIYKNSITVKILFKKIWRFIKGYFSGEWGKPGPKAKRDMIFFCNEGRYDSARIWLLKYGDHPGAIDCTSHLDGRTPLMIACANRDKKLAGLLLSRHASPHVRDIFGKYAIHYASENGMGRIANKILAKQAKVDVRDISDRTPLMLAAEGGHYRAVGVLLEFGASLDAHDDIDKWTPLHYAAKSGNCEAINRLMEAGAKLEPHSRSKQTPREVALDHKNTGGGDSPQRVGCWRGRRSDFLTFFLNDVLFKRHFFKQQMACR